MSDLRMFDRDFLAEFIELYRQEECLWKVKSEAYLNKNLKNAAYEKLVNKIREVHKNADTDFVKKKINGLRTNFRSELKKINHSKRSGASADSVYKPKLWYFELLSFLSDQEIPRAGKSSRDDSVDHLDESGSTSTINLGEDGNSQSSWPMSPDSLVNTRKVVTKKKKVNSDEILHKVSARLDECQQDEFDIVGKNIAAKLRKVSPSMRIFAEKLLHDVIYEAQLGTLNRSSCIVTTLVKENFSSGGPTSVYIPETMQSGETSSTSLLSFVENFNPE